MLLEVRKVVIHKWGKPVEGGVGKAEGGVLVIFFLVMLNSQ